MNRKTIVLAALVCGLLVTILVAQQSSQKPSGTVQRYQLIAAQVEDVNNEGSDVTRNAIFLVDTSTGGVWRYEPTELTKTPNGKGQLLFDRFYPVKIDVSRLPSQ